MYRLHLVYVVGGGLTLKHRVVVAFHNEGAATCPHFGNIEVLGRNGVVAAGDILYKVNIFLAVFVYKTLQRSNFVKSLYGAGVSAVTMLSYGVVTYDQKLLYLLSKGEKTVVLQKDHSLRGYLVGSLLMLLGIE